MIYHRVVGQAEHCHSCNKELSYRPITVFSLVSNGLLGIACAIARSFYVVDLLVAMAQETLIKKDKDR